MQTIAKVLAVFTITLATANVTHAQLWKRNRTNSNRNATNCEQCVSNAATNSNTIVNQPLSSQPTVQAPMDSQTFVDSQAIVGFETQPVPTSTALGQTAGEIYAESQPGSAIGIGSGNVMGPADTVFDQGEVVHGTVDYGSGELTMQSYVSGQSFDAQPFVQPHAQPIEPQHAPQWHTPQQYPSQPYANDGGQTISQSMDAASYVAQPMNTFATPVSYATGSAMPAYGIPVNGYVGQGIGGHSFGGQIFGGFDGHGFDGEMSKDVGYEGPGDMRTHLWNDHSSDLQREGISQGLLMAMPSPLVQQWHNYFHGTEGSPGRFR